MSKPRKPDPDKWADCGAACVMWLVKAGWLTDTEAATVGKRGMQQAEVAKKRAAKLKRGGRGK